MKIQSTTHARGPISFGLALGTILGMFGILAGPNSARAQSNVLGIEGTTINAEYDAGDSNPAPDPTTQGWNEDLRGSVSVGSAGSTPPAWNIVSPDTDSLGWYIRDGLMSAEEQEEAHVNGFLTTVNLRINGTFSNNTGARIFSNLTGGTNPGSGGSARMDLKFGTESNGDLTALVPGSDDGSGNAVTSTVAGGEGEFHEFAIHYKDNDNKLADLYVDGTIVESDFTLDATGNNRLRFGNATFEETNVDYQSTRFETVPEPEAFALMGGLVALGAVMLRRRRRS